MNEQIACGVGETGDVDLKPIAFGGHCFYVRKGKTQAVSDGIHLPDSVKDTCQYVEVLAKGPRIGKPCNRDHMDKFKRAKYLRDMINVGDVLLCPNQHQGIRVSPLFTKIDPYEFFIEESVPLVIYKKGYDE